MTIQQEYRALRGRTIGRISVILAELNDLAANEMGNLTWRESLKFHKATTLLQRLVDDQANNQT